MSQISPSNCPFVGKWPKTCLDDGCCSKKLQLDDKYVYDLAVDVVVTVAVVIVITIPIIINNVFSYDCSVGDIDGGCFKNCNMIRGMVIISRTNQ